MNEPTIAQLIEEIRALKKRVAWLEGTTSFDEPDERELEKIRANLIARGMIVTNIPAESDRHGN